MSQVHMRAHIQARQLRSPGQAPTLEIAAGDWYGSGTQRGA